MKMEQAVPNGNETGPEESNHILYVLWFYGDMQSKKIAVKPLLQYSQNIVDTKQTY